MVLAGHQKVPRSGDPGQLRRPDKCFSDFSRDQSNESIAVSRPGPLLLAAQMPPPVLPGECRRPLRRSQVGKIFYLLIGGQLVEEVIEFCIFHLYLTS